MEVFADALPAEPDNIRPSSRGYWVGFTSGRNSTNLLIPDVVAPYTTMKRLFVRAHHAIGTLLMAAADILSHSTLKEFAYKVHFYPKLVTRKINC